jgi:hypothetical protein
MGTQDFKRNLSAFFTADMAGYSRLMGEDEPATVKTLEAHTRVMFWGVLGQIHQIDFIHSRKGVHMRKKTLAIMCALLFSVTILTSVTSTASADDEKAEKYMWTITAKCTNKVKTVTETYCGKKGEAIAKVKGQLRREKGCGEIEVVSAEKGEKCN